MRKTLVLDTNVLLHDPDAISKFNDNDVVIPLSVLEELDSMKRLSDELGKNARYVIRYIDSLKAKKAGDLHSGVMIDKGIKVRIYLEARGGQEKRAFPLPTDRNKILLAAYQIREQGEPVVLVSKDFVVRVKAEAIGLEAEDYENLKASYDNLYRGYRKIRLEKREIDQFLKDGHLTLDLKDIHPNEYVLMTCAEQSTGVAKYNSQTKRLEALGKITKDIWGIQPLNVEQRCAMDLLLRDEIKLITLLGPAGTGKTLMALATGMKKVFDDNIYTKILVSRPIMPLGKDIGFLPGTKDEKLFHWMQPIFDNLEYLCQSTTGDASTPRRSSGSWTAKRSKWKR